MKNKPIIIVAGEPNSVFLETFFKSIKKRKFFRPLILICSIKILKFHMKKLNFKRNVNLIDPLNINFKNLNNKCINIINVKYEQNYTFKKISKVSNDYIKNSFNLAFEIINSGISDRLINGPISKKSFLNKKFLGITEYISHKFSVKENAMLIHNKKLSVCPVTTHLPLKVVSKNINKKLIKEKITLIDNFYKIRFGYRPRIAVLGLNPHCESIYKINEDEKIIKPTVRQLSNLGFKTSGPYSADTIFLKKNRSKFDVVVGMYHDQVLTPMKTLFEYDAINITLGLPFTRISPDHGPNENMIGENTSNPLSLIRAIEFLDKKN